MPDRQRCEVLVGEFLRVSESIPEGLDFLGRPARLATRLEAERSEAGGVARQDVCFVLDLQAVDEQAIGVVRSRSSRRSARLLQASRGMTSCQE